MRRKVEFNMGRETTSEDVWQLGSARGKWIRSVHADLSFSEPVEDGEMAEIVERLRRAVTNEFVDMATMLPTLPVELVGLSGELMPEN